MSATATAPIDDEIESEHIECGEFPEPDSQIGTHSSATVQLAEDDSEAQQSERRFEQSPEFEETARRWMWGFLIALAAMQTYFVQEMLAALFLFTLAFAVFGVIALAFYVANRASQASLASVEPIARVAARAGRRGFGFVEYLSKKPFRRPHSETAR
jgi:hypothetical protein